MHWKTHYVNIFDASQKPRPRKDGGKGAACA